MLHGSCLLGIVFPGFDHTEAVMDLKSGLEKIVICFDASAELSKVDIEHVPQIPHGSDLHPLRSRSDVCHRIQNHVVSS